MYYKKNIKIHIPKLHYRYKIFSYFLIPILLTTIVSICMNQFYLWFFQQKTEAGYIKTLSSISENIDNSLYELFQTSILLTSSGDIKDVIYSVNIFNPDDYAKVSQAITLLSRFRATKHYIQNVFVLHSPDNLIMASGGSASADEFFNSICHYDIYDRNFWTGISSDGHQYKTLKTSTVENIFTGTKTRVIPVVQFGIGDTSSKNLFVINMREDYIAGLLQQNRLTPNSELYVLSKEGEVISKSSNDTEVSINFNNVANQLEKGTGPIFVTKINGQKSLVVSYTADTNALSSFTYFAVVPYSDLIRESTTTRTLPILIIVFSLVLGIIISFVMSNKIYNPVGLLTSLLMETTGTLYKPKTYTDEFTYINLEIKNIINNNKNLTQDLSLALPFVCEQYLFKILNDNELYLDEEISDFLIKHGFSFKYNCYAVIITDVSYTQPFYESYSSEEQLALYREMAKVMKLVFPSEFQPYVLTMEKKKLHVILNLPDEACESITLEAIGQFHKNLNIDSNLFRVQSGVGRIHKHLSGLQQSYKEAEIAVSQLSPLEQQAIKVYEKVECINKFSYSMQEENKLFNYLIKGDIESVNNILEEIIQKNISANISESYFKKLYIQIYNTGVRALSHRNSKASDLLEGSAIDIINNENHRSSKEIGEFVRMFLGRLVNLNSSAAGKIDLNVIRQYIDENYANDIYLEQMSDKYGITPKYMSKLIKEALGIPFHQYLSNLRIDKSKELLRNSKKSITDIAAEVGFNSRNTFIRMFKKLEGITPSEYRNLSK